MRDRSFYQALRAVGKLTGTIDAAMKLAERRRAVGAPSTDSKQWREALRRKYLTPISLGRADMLSAHDIASNLRPRVRRLGDYIESRSATSPVSVRDKDEGRYSSRCTWRKISHQIIVRSYGYVVSGGMVLKWHILDDRGETKSLHGYRWGRDKNGIKLFSVANSIDDFHPTTEDVRLGAKHCIAKLKENATTRRKFAKQIKSNERKSKAKIKQEMAIIRRAEREGLAVCVTDSIKAGNCLAGTLNWAARHGLQPGKHYRPSEVLKKANGDRHRVALVVAYAMRRHQLEMSRGYAELADHIAR